MTEQNYNPPTRNLSCADYMQPFRKESTNDSTNSSTNSSTNDSSCVCKWSEYTNCISRRNSSITEAIKHGIGAIAVITCGMVCVGQASYVLTHNYGYREYSHQIFKGNRNIIRGIGYLISLLGTTSIYCAHHLYKKTKHSLDQALVSNNYAKKILFESK
jgi:hypothetical protein